MEYLIDGYNFLFSSFESKKPLQVQRALIIESLRKEFSRLHLRGILVFDGAPASNDRAEREYKSPLTIVYTPKFESADSFILQYLETSETPSHWTVVTNDRFLASQARSLKAHTLSSEGFFHLLEKKTEALRKKKSAVDGEKAFRESKQELERLLQIFEGRKTDPFDS